MSRTWRPKHESAMCSTGTGSVSPFQIQSGTDPSTRSARSSAFLLFIAPIVRGGGAGSAAAEQAVDLVPLLQRR